jgi:GNAT superfamily N-acetyltransferase
MQSPNNGPRPLNPFHDLGQVADLLEQVFNKELDSGGRQMIREARAISHTGPLLYLLTPWSGASSALSPGFVWEKDGRVIGNVTLMQSRKHPKHWQIANVAVHPNHRKQGIATQLMQVGLENIRRRGGTLVSLQVRQSNPAISLYKKLGFDEYGTVTRWAAGRQIQPYAIRTSGQIVRPAVRDDWRGIWKLFQSASPAAWGWPDPLGREDFAPHLLRNLGRLLNGETRQRWVIGEYGAAELDGFVELRRQSRRPHRLTLRAHPAHAGYVEGDLLAYALKQLPEPDYSTVLLDHPAGDIATEARLREGGFQANRTLLLMQRSEAGQGD